MVVGALDHRKMVAAQKGKDWAAGLVSRCPALLVLKTVQVEALVLGEEEAVANRVQKEMMGTRMAETSA